MYRWAVSDLFLCYTFKRTDRVSFVAFHLQMLPLVKKSSPGIHGNSKNWWLNETDLHEVMSKDVTYYGWHSEKLNKSVHLGLSAVSTGERVNQALQLFADNSDLHQSQEDSCLVLESMRSEKKADTMVLCGYPGCNKSYTNHQNVLRHQKRDHGRKQFEKGLYIKKSSLHS